jgi:hypothetical protein
MDTYTTRTPSAQPQPLFWPASYKGRGIWIDKVGGRFVGIVEGGYRSAAYPTTAQALADITAWVDAQGVTR